MLHRRLGLHADLFWQGMHTFKHASRLKHIGKDCSPVTYGMTAMLRLCILSETLNPESVTRYSSDSFLPLLKLRNILDQI